MENMNLGERLTPLMERLRAVTEGEFLDGPTLDTTISILRTVGAFTIPKLEALLRAANAIKEEIYCTDIPALLAELGITEGKLPDGTIVTKELVYTVKANDKDALASWLMENGYGSSIEDNLSFEKGQYSASIDEFLRSSGASFSRTQDVHPQTLKKVVREHIEAGLGEPPAEAASVTLFERGVVKTPKTKGF